MNREELIEEAAKAMHRAVYGGSVTWPDAGQHIRGQWIAVAHAALAVYSEAWSHERTVNIPRAEWERLKRFEQAHTPTDDEREALANLIPLDLVHDRGREGFPQDAFEAADAILAAGFRRTVQGEPTATCPKCGTTVTDQTPSTFYTRHDETCGGALEEPQGEPTAAAVAAAGEVLYGISWGTELADPDLVRDALRAAAATQTGESR